MTGLGCEEEELTFAAEEAPSVHTPPTQVGCRLSWSVGGSQSYNSDSTKARYDSANPF